eukprot:TRINITY_DN775_c0_g1_i2.p1 TRINITY_DN775_c0_g1~~TRINITY_DN775_c0_g1_i2.p1  ORF type:complete len:445 (-),score=113.28 TRINITY_DN775_c0_g1_i2:147-1481(-)
MFVGTNDRPENARTATELRRTQRALASAAGALLAPRLLRGTGDLGDRLGLVRAGAALGQLPQHHAGQDVLAGRQAEHGFRQLDLADGFVVQILDGRLHLSALRRDSFSSRSTEGAGERHALGQLLLDGVLDEDESALMARDGALDQDQTALGVDRHDLQVLDGDGVDTHVTGHLLVLEGLTGILTATGRTDGAVRHGHAVGRPQTAEIPALHTASKTLTQGRALHVHELAGNEMIRGQLSTNLDQVGGSDAELDELLLRLDLGLGEHLTLGLGDVLHLGLDGAELEGRVAILLFRLVGDDLDLVQLQHSHRHALTLVGEDAGHADLLRDQSGSHLFFSITRDILRSGEVPYSTKLDYSLISTSTPAARSSFISASTVCGVGSTMSSRRLWVRISNCSRDFLSMCGLRFTVNFSNCVGSGIGPRTRAPVRFAVLTISLVLWSSTR